MSIFPLTSLIPAHLNDHLRISLSYTALKLVHLTPHSLERFGTLCETLMSARINSCAMWWVFSCVCVVPRGSIVMWLWGNGRCSQSTREWTARNTTHVKKNELVVRHTHDHSKTGVCVCHIRAINQASTSIYATNCKRRILCMYIHVSKTHARSQYVSANIEFAQWASARAQVTQLSYALDMPARFSAKSSEHTHTHTTPLSFTGACAHTHTCKKFTTALTHARIATVDVSFISESFRFQYARARPALRCAKFYRARDHEHCPKNKTKNTLCRHSTANINTTQSIWRHDRVCVR